MTEQERLAKNKKISEKKALTIERHSKMICKSFTVKIQINKISRLQKEALNRIFLEAKWYKNYILNYSENNDLYHFDTKIKNITKKDKDMNDVPVNLINLSASQRQCIFQRIKNNIRTLSTLKKKGFQNPGKLKYSKEENMIELRQFKTDHKIISSKRVKLTGIPKTLPVNGLNQFINIPEIEICNARLLKRASDFYIQFVTYSPKGNSTEKINQIVGIDFGCQTSFTLSTGEKINVKVPETERLKKLQRNLSRKQKGSKNFIKNELALQKEYFHISNIKNDIANKFVHRFNQYEKVIIQDEQLQNWHKSGHGKAIQHSILGRVKSRLKNLDNVVVLNKFVPTTKYCWNCGKLNSLKLSDRTYKCDCGLEEDRDLHAARNMIRIYNINIGREPTKFTPMETSTSGVPTVKVGTLSTVAEVGSCFPLGKR